MSARSQYVIPIAAGTLLGTILFGGLFKLAAFKGSAGGLLVSDSAVLISALVYWVAVLTKQVQVPPRFLLKGFLIWFGVTLLATLIAVPQYGHGQSLVALAYFFRLFAYVTMIFVGYAIFSKRETLVLRYLVYACLGLLVLGAVILQVLPNFSVLVPLGWDPHVGRLTSTWLDPNFFGTFLAMMFSVFLAFSERAERAKRPIVRIGYILFMLMLWVGIYLTFSRSALVTLIVGGITVALLTRWRNLVYVLALVAIMLVLPSRLQGRIASSVSYSVNTAKSTVGQSSTSQQVAVSADPTANDRVESWKAAIAVFKERPFLGTGYNFYPYYRLRTGKVTAQEVAAVHSATGSDSSLLTLLATTGIIGVLAFLYWWGILFGKLWRSRKIPIVAGTIGALAAWFISSFFNNTLLYAHIMLPMLIVTGMALAHAGADKTDR